MPFSTPPQACYHVGMSRVEELVEEVHALSPEDRERFEQLLEVMEGGDDLHPAWAAEIERRIQLWREGKAQSLTWEEVRAKLRAKIDAAKR